MLVKDNHYLKLIKRLRNSKAYTTGKFNVLGRDSVSGKYLIECKYGLCSLISGDVLNIRNIPTIKSAVNKEEYFINQSREIHGDRYSYENLDMSSGYQRVTITCPIHGDFSQLKGGHLRPIGTACLKCSYIERGQAQSSTSEEFVRKSTKIHKDKYTYDKVIYKNSKTKVIITCKIHGDYQQAPSDHLYGKGCQQCGRIVAVSKTAETNPVWTRVQWKEASLRSRYFDSYKIYFLKCWDENEEFIKIGRTYRKINLRYNSFRLLPYRYEIYNILTFENAEITWDTEVEILKELNDFQYIPVKVFGGRSECFSKDSINNIDNIIKYILEQKDQ